MEIGAPFEMAIGTKGFSVAVGISFLNVSECIE